NSTFSSALTTLVRNVSGDSTVTVQSITVVETLPTGLLVDFQVPLLVDRDLPVPQIFKFNVSIVTNYSRPDVNLNCSGVPGAEIVSEFIFTDTSVSEPLIVGAVGGLCRHTQPPECVNGGTPTPNNTEP